MPADEYVFVVFLWAGLVVLNQVPSPKLQFQAVGVPVEVSLNRIVSGGVPDVRFAMKPAAGMTRGSETMI